MPAIIGSIILIAVFVFFSWQGPANSRPAKVEIIEHHIPVRLVDVKLPEIKAMSIVTLDSESGARLLDYKADERRSLASLTKLMTAMVFLETAPDWDKKIVILKQDIQSDNKPNIFVDDEINLRDLFTISLMASDNTATTALVRSTGLTNQAFTELMNNKVKQLRLAAYFIEPTGLDAGNQGTALSVAKMIERAYKYPEIEQALKFYHYTFKVSQQITRRATSTNQLIGRSLPAGAKMLIGKTGHLNEAGYCFAGVFETKGKKIITVILGSSQADNRFIDTINILDWTLGAYLWENNSDK